MGSNDSPGKPQALEDIKALKKSLATIRGADQAIDGCQVNIVRVLKDMASEADLEHVREGVIVVSEMARNNIDNVADAIVATAARISKTNEG